MSTSVKFADSDSKNESTGAALPPVIIQCPECETRFAVDPAAIAAVEEPKFHCSRCDHIFGANEPTSRATTRPLPPPTPEPTHTSAGAPTVDEGIVAVYRNPRAKSPTSEEVKPLEIPRRWDTAVRSSAPRETVAEQVALDFSQSTPKGYYSDRDTKMSDDQEITIKDFGTIKNSPLIDDGSALRSLSPSPQSSESRSTMIARTLNRLDHPSKASFWKYLALPIAACFALLLLLSVTFRMSDSVAEGFVASAIPGAFTAAPGELFIRNSKFQKITLDNGEVVRVISGTIVNDASNSFKDIELEGALFDASGRTIGSIRADAAATLAKAKIRSLTPEMIQDLQSGRNIKRFILRPGEDRDFALALVGDDFNSAHHFGARIYSAKSL